MRRVGAAALLCALLCGCSWRDAGDLSAVTAGAIAPVQGGYALTAELAIPSADSAVPAAQLVTAQADSIAQAIDRAGYGRDAQLYWSHARMLLLDEQLLRAGIGDAVRELTLSREVRPSVRLCAVRDTDAAAVLADGASLSGDPVGFALGDSAEQAVRRSQAPDMPLYRVLDRVCTEGIDAVLPAVTVRDGQAALCGTALLHDGVLCGWLDEEQTTVLCLLMQSGDTAAVYDGTYRMKLDNLRAAVSADAADGVTFAVEVGADIACESDGQARRSAASLRAQCIEVIELLQRAGCDALGLGRAWQRANAAAWEQADADAWRTAPVTVRVTLRSTQSAEGGST